MPFDVATVNPEAAARFWMRVRKTATCWLWEGSVSNDGYGLWNSAHRNGMVRAHRFAYMATYGPIPTGMVVRHSVCDVILCVRPDHLRAGTQRENIEERDAKGRTARGKRNGSYARPERRPFGARNGSVTHPERVNRGERVGTAKLTYAQVREIRRLHAEGRTQTSLATQFGVARSMIGMIVRYEWWREEPVDVHHPTLTGPTEAN